MAHITALARNRLDEKAPQRVVADARDERRLEAQSGTAERGVRRRTAEVLRKARHILEARADLLRIEVDREAAEADDIELAVRCEWGGVLHRYSGLRRERAGAA